MTQQTIENYNKKLIDKDELKKYSLKLKESYENCINMFNSLSTNIGKHLLNDFPMNQNLYIYHNIVNNIIKKKPVEPISIFVVNVYSNDSYKESILNGDENFFRENRHENLTDNDEDRLKALFQFKSCWDQMNDYSKKFIKEAMKTLLNICEIYIEKKDDYNKIKKILK
jgi:hypothetical protein